MRLLVTGARGFVMSVFVRRFLERHPDATVHALDVQSPDPVLDRYWSGVDDRVDFHTTDLTDGREIARVVTCCAPDVVVHAASVTLVPDWERANPGRYIDVNVTGTLRLLEALRAAGTTRRFVLVSSGAVYGAGAVTVNASTEASPLIPDEMYGVSKVAAEMITSRFATLTGTPTAIIRPAKVFGRMERPSGSRTGMSLPFHLLEARRNRSPLLVTPRTMSAGGDWIGVEDVASALSAVIESDLADVHTFNISGGRFVGVAELADLFQVELRVSDDTDALDIDPQSRWGKDGVLDHGALSAALGWRPRNLRDQVREYLAAEGDDLQNDDGGHVVHMGKDR